MPPLLARTVVLLILAIATLTAGAEGRALLVGVSDYPTLPAGLERTVGARNDVLQLREVLRQRGFKPERIRVLADGVADAAVPTRVNILQALDDLAQASGPGDLVFVHFSGHGSLEPGPSASDGPVPTFLPLDIGRWDGRMGVVENAIRQSDLRPRIDRIANRGAFVWGVFDACHAAALVRRPDAPRVHRRFVEPADLGVPLGAIERSEAIAEGAGSSAPPVIRGLIAGGTRATRGGGGTVFFYAAQAGESAVELKLPLGAASSRSHGLFSYMVAQALQDARPMNYRQLGQGVLVAYGSISAAYSTPVFTGDALDRLVLGQESFPVRQWPLLAANELGVDAGLLSGLVPGTVLAVLPGPTAADNELIGHLRVLSADLGRATLAPVAHSDRTAVRRIALSPGQYLRLVQSPPQYTLRVAYAQEGCAAGCPATAAVQRLRNDGVAGVDLRWVESAESADILVRYRMGRIDLISPAGTVVGGVSSQDVMTGHGAAAGGSAEAVAGRLAETLRALARSRNLLALAARYLMESPVTGLATSIRRVANGAKGRSADGGVADEVFSPERTLRVFRGDALTLTVENRGQVPLDVTALYLDAGSGITVLFPKGNGESNRLAPGTRRSIEDLEIKAPPSGLERLMVIGRQAMPGAERADFSFLQHSALTAAAGLPAGELDVFADAAFAEYRRRGREYPAAPRGNIAVQVFTLDVRSLRMLPNATQGDRPR